VTLIVKWRRRKLAGTDEIKVVVKGKPEVVAGGYDEY
jgi:hypothetical protein